MNRTDEEYADQAKEIYEPRDVGYGEVLLELRDHPQDATVAFLSEWLCVSVPVVRRMLAALVKVRAVDRKRSGREFRYFLTKGS